MSEEKGTKVSVNVIIPPLKTVKLEVSPPTPQTINLLLRIHPDLVFITNYDLISQSGSIFSEELDIQKNIDPKTGFLTLKIQHLPYNEQTALEHAQHFTRICFSHSSRRHTTDCSQSVVGWITRNYGSDNNNSNLNVNDLDGIYPDKYQNSSLPRIIKSLDLSGSPLTPKELLQGCILKLKAKTIEKEKFTIYGSKSGWFVKPNKIFPTLHLLFCSISEFYSNNYFLISDKWCKLRSAERQPFYSTNKSVKTFIEKITDKKGEVPERNCLRLFERKVDTSSLSNLTLDDLIEEAKMTGENESFVNQLEMQFVAKSVDAVSSIEGGSLAPFCGTSSFLYQDLFISKVEVLAESYKDRGGFDTANRSICNEIQAYQQLAGIEKDTQSAQPNEGESIPYRFVRPICIDFFTHRFVGQTCIPGLISHRSPIEYGYAPSEDGSRKEFVASFVTDQIKADMMKIGIGESKIKGAKEPIFTSSETNGVSSIDGNLYFSDYRRVTPRDANYPDPVKHHGCVIRSEAVASYAIFLKLEAHSKELIELGGDKNNFYHIKSEDSTDEQRAEKIQKLEQRRTEIIEEEKVQLFDINALTIDSERYSSIDAKGFPQNIKDVAKFLVDCIIPKFIREYVEQSSFIVDGKTIVQEMHSRGINARYLGRILSILRKENKADITRKYFCLSLESEIISRSFKHIKRLENSDIESVLADLNVLVGLTNSQETFSKLFDQIQKVASDKFGAKNLSKPKSCQRFLIIQRILSFFGVSLYSWKDVDTHQIGINDIFRITPLVKFPFTKNARFSAAIEIATSIFSQESASSKALSMFSAALQIANADAIDPFDVGISLCYFYMSLIYDQQGDFENAFNACVTSTIIQERYSDQISPEIIIRYSLLARFAKMTNQKKLSFAFADRAANLARIIAPFHPWVGIEFTVAADLAVDISYDFAVQYAEDKLNYFAKIAQLDEIEQNEKNILKKQMAKIYLSSSKALLQSRKINEALDKVKKALELDPENEEIKGACDLIKSQLK